jgi:hypothetical protein
MMKTRKLSRDFSIINRLSIIAFSAIATVSILEIVFYGAMERGYDTLICLFMIGLHVYKYLKQ